MIKTTTIAPGANILVRDAVWRVQQMERTSEGDRALRVVGLSEIVRDQEALFIERFERSIQVLDPVDTALVPDESPQYRASLLYLESLLRRVPPTDEKLYVGYRAAMDLLNFQLEPARLALSQTRQRILIADAVGLGKTLEAGILLSELILRGRAKRILVVAVKSMLTQFQKEMWSRFSIPLVRLDSLGLQRIRQNIPTNHNPFYYYDRTIISIDTLKQDNAFRTYVEQAHWDVIVIDEAHNVAARGTGLSQRARLARLLSSRSDTLILLSATPHDGKARSFASLMNMLDPTAIADPDKYTKEDIDGLFLRRFKKDVVSELRQAFPEREVIKKPAQATPTEESLFSQLVGLSFTRLDKQKGSGQMLFKTTLEKALFSSPAACLQSTEARIQTLKKHPDAASYANDVSQLESFAGALKKIQAKEFSKYQKLLSVLKDDLGWSVQEAKKDRLVIFTERIETLQFLKTNLKSDLGIQDEQLEVLHGGVSDLEQNRIVEDFGKENAKVRVLLASDIASEGINLHYLSHKMIHFDIPWSLMVFQQRNGRIDRYGQENKPRIVYLLTKSNESKIKGDTRILELLVEKDTQAAENIGDPSALMGVYDVIAEEQITAQAIEQQTSVEDFNKQFNNPIDLPQGIGPAGFNPLDLMGELSATPAPAAPAVVRGMPPSVFANDFTYLSLACDHLRESLQIESTVSAREQRIELKMPPDLKQRFQKLPIEVMPMDGVLVLSADAEAVKRDIVAARKEEQAWPRVQHLWPLHPVFSWLNDKLSAHFGRHSAPVLTLSRGLVAGESVLLTSGLLPNRRGQPLLQQWFAAVFVKGRFLRMETLETLLQRTSLGKTPLANAKTTFDDGPLRVLLPTAISETKQRLLLLRAEFEKKLNPRLDSEMKKLEILRKRQMLYLQEKYKSHQSDTERAKRSAEERQVKKIFDNYLQWVQDALSTEPEPFVQVLAALRHPEM